MKKLEKKQAGLLALGLTALLHVPLTGADNSEELEARIKTLEAKLEKLEDKETATGAAPNEAENKTRIGGYGELHYNDLHAKSAGADNKTLDLHRFVLFFGHEFTEKVSFHSEVEIEHAFVSDSGTSPGEVEIEQAYVDFKYHENHSALAGVVLMPVGIINETHEPPTFYGVERNPVENRIIPTTWREGGLSLKGQITDGWNYDVAATSGLNTSSGSRYAVRSGRQMVGNAKANDLALTGRVKYTGFWGEWAASASHQEDITQSLDKAAGRAMLLETHAIYNYRGFTLKALYATWDLEGAGPAAVGADEQTGWYVEPSYKINESVGVFARYNETDNQAGDSAASKMVQVNVGANYWPVENVVLKADYEDQDNDTGVERKGINLGVGYQF